MGSHNIEVFLLYAPAYLSFWKYWPDDGILRPKLVAISRIIIKNIYIVVPDGVHI
jgi:hypothetical protein